MLLVPLKPSHREAVVTVLRRTDSFREEELQVAMELIDCYLADQKRGLSDPSGYRCVVATEAEEVGGFLCFGRTPMTEHTYDLYWIAVDPTLQGQGVGRRLYAFLEAVVLEEGGGHIRIETSSQEGYGATRGFYQRLGFDLAAHLEDFYAKGDDLVVYYKSVG